MNRFSLVVRVFVLTIVALAFASISQAQATRTWVSGVGDDVNPCSRTAPCKTFAGAISKTAVRGEIDCPAPCVPSIVMFLVIVTVPKPPGSRQSISPLSAVFEMAPAKVLQGAVRLQGLRSSPTPDTQVLDWAWVREANVRVKHAIIKILR